MTQRNWDSSNTGDRIPDVEFPLSVYRLVMTAGANRDFNAIHHNSEHAKSTGAPEMYANTLFLQGMWERAVREYIGMEGTILHIHGFRMRSFNTVGDTVTVKGEVVDKRVVDGKALLELKVWSENKRGVSVGPGSVLVSLPRSAAPGTAA